MADLVTATFRMDRSVRDYLRDRAHRRDRSMNGELVSIVRDLMRNEETAGAKLGGTSPTVSGTTAHKEGQPQ